jgi:hypothetical protein
MMHLFGRQIEDASLHLHHREVARPEVFPQAGDGGIPVQTVPACKNIDSGISILRPGMDGEM